MQNVMHLFTSMCANKFFFSLDHIALQKISINNSEIKEEKKTENMCVLYYFSFFFFFVVVVCVVATKMLAVT